MKRLLIAAALMLSTVAYANDNRIIVPIGLVNIAGVQTRAYLDRNSVVKLGTMKQFRALYVHPDNKRALLIEQMIQCDIPGFRHIKGEQLVEGKTVAVLKNMPTKWFGVDRIEYHPFFELLCTYPR